MKAQLKQLRNWGAVIACGFSIFLSGCTSSEHEQIISIGKCAKAANYLEDSSLRAATEYRAKIALKDVPANPRYAMEVAQEIRDEAEPYGSSTSIVDVLKVALEWKNSSYCKQVEADFATHIAERVKSNLPVIADTTGDPASCQKYVAQVDIYTSRHAKKYHAQMGQVLQATLNASAGRLKDFQMDAVKHKINSTDFGEFALDVYAQCQAGGALSEKIGTSQFVQKLQSPATKEINSFLTEARTTKGDCGEFPQDYCAADFMIMAAERALQRSVQCDRNPLEKNCTSTSDILIKQEFKALENEKLVSMQEKYENYIAHPEKYNYNTYSNIHAIADKCKRGAIDKGLRDGAYSDYVAANCMPQARIAFLKPQQEILDRIKARLSS
ncbi:hypothetical protein [Janthinobacterium sp. 1_2014MBL_MicDiv]|uniref:hypothetical protein n=1 Tax=Janthinobacterium sp. 1_2014MBL_MicDiv TaxID=1644131 RepID=UPI0012EB5467|nr:hypothetical protein [Janthinobacterium sp. 1_2014MBL_MicDiv]